MAARSRAWIRSRQQAPQRQPSSTRSVRQLLEMRVRRGLRRGRAQPGQARVVGPPLLRAPGRDEPRSTRSCGTRACACSRSSRPRDFRSAWSGKVTLYAQTGRYQIVVTKMEPAGLGAREALLRALRAKLKAEGVLDPSRKRPLPSLPRCIALVTSPDGAAVHDLIKVILGRFPRAHLILVPVTVQGDGAALEIADGIRRAGLWRGVEVVVTGPRRRQRRGPLGVQRGGRRARDLRVAGARGLRRSATRPTRRSRTRSPTSARRRRRTRGRSSSRCSRRSKRRSRAPSSAADGRSRAPRRRRPARGSTTCGPRPGPRASCRAASRPHARGLAECATAPPRGACSRASADDRSTRSRLGTRVLAALNPTAVLGRGFSLTWTEEGGARKLVARRVGGRARDAHPDDVRGRRDLLSEVRKPVDRAARQRVRIHRLPDTREEALVRNEARRAERAHQAAREGRSRPRGRHPRRSSAAGSSTRTWSAQLSEFERRIEMLTRGLDGQDRASAAHGLDPERKHDQDAPF